MDASYSCQRPQGEGRTLLSVCCVRQILVSVNLGRESLGSDFRRYSPFMYFSLVRSSTADIDSDHDLDITTLW